MIMGDAYFNMALLLKLKTPHFLVEGFLNVKNPYSDFCNFRVLVLFRSFAMRIT